MIKSSKYLLGLQIMDCPEHIITNTSEELIANKRIEFCFRVKDDYILQKTALVVPDFGS